MDDDPGDVNNFKVKQLEYLPVTAIYMDLTSRDPRFSKVFMYVQSGWPAVKECSHGQHIQCSETGTRQSYNSATVSTKMSYVL